MKTFSLDEAQSLLPILESLLRRAIAAKASAGQVETDMMKLSQKIFLAGGLLMDVAAVARKRMAQRAAVQQAQDAIQRAYDLRAHTTERERMTIEMHVRDEGRFKGGWAFWVTDGVAPAQQVPYAADCYSCHLQHGAVDTTFVQFYPTAQAIAKKAGTFHEP